MINEFNGPFRFLSNFAPIAVRYQGIMYPTAEHAYQAAKTTDPRELADILHCAKPADAKRLGQKVTLRPDWEEIKVGVMGYPERASQIRKLISDASTGLGNGEEDVSIF